MALLNTGKVMVWGTNQNGDLGIGTFVGPSHACSTETNIKYKGCSLQPIEVPGVSEVTAVSAGDDYDMALAKMVLSWRGVKMPMGSWPTVTILARKAVVGSLAKHLLTKSRVYLAKLSLCQLIGRVLL